MNEDERLAAVERQLEQVLGRLAGVEAQLRRLEERSSIPTPPPVITQPRVTPPATASPEPRFGPAPSTQAAPSPPEPVEAPVFQTATATPEPSPAKAPTDDIEYRIGSRGLLWVGAFVTVLGMLYLVALAISRGYISPAAQFGGELALCFGFIAFGLIKRDLREDFGNLMVGIGSCGVFFSLAGAHVYKDVLSGEALVSLFMTWSLANLGFSWWRESRSFWAIGLAGGLVASVLPLRNDNPTLAAVLHVSAVLPAVLIAGRGRWSELMILGWTASGVAVLPLCASPPEWTLPVVVIYVSSLLWAVAYAARSEKTTTDPQEIFPFIAVVVAGLGAFALRGGVDGTLHLGVFAGVVLILGWLLKSNALDLAGAVVAIVLIPYTFDAPTTEIIQIACAIGLALLSLRWSPKALTGLACLALVLAATSHAVLLTQSELASWQQESLLLLGLVAAVTLCGVASNRVQPGAEFATVATALIALPFALRLTWVTTVRPELGWSAYGSMTLAVVAYGTGLVVVGGLRKWTAALVSGWAMFAVGLYIYAVGATLDDLSVGADALVVVTALALAIAATLGTRKATGAHVGLSVCAGGLVMGLVARILFLVFTAVVGWPIGPAAFLALLAVTAVCAVIGRWRLRIDLAALGTASLFVSLFVFREAVPAGLAFELAYLFPGLAIVVLLVESFKKTSFYDAASIGGAVVAWAGWTHLVMISLEAATTTINRDGSITTAWISFAVVLIALGFIFDRRVLRLMGIIVFGATVGKVLLVDLAALDAGIRVVLLLALGVAMIGGAYAYIRRQRREP